MSNEKNDEKTFGRKPKGSDIKSNSSRVSTVPNGKLNGGSRWDENMICYEGVRGDLRKAMIEKSGRWNVEGAGERRED